MLGCNIELVCRKMQVEVGRDGVPLARSTYLLVGPFVEGREIGTTTVIGIKWPSRTMYNILEYR